MSTLSQKPATVRTRRWREANPERWRELQRDARRRARKPCRRCGGPVPWPSPGAGYCGDDCRRAARLARAAQKRAELLARFRAYKESIGCRRCGYDRYGGALDFHHREAGMKERRIEATHWASGSPLILAELAKCDLLCKNCHAEIHGGGVH